ncbi:hypothetical protein INT48_002231 [Thamnidium elegans]|uniref:Uncharacterized protein n=1 Tax=Thamnidium elegans TaxID=101142 RepID=A0A8H7SZL6_9FUNG|nr:hypothetical protein INT48_002231 [Thamnidium elegans]
MPRTNTNIIDAFASAVLAVVTKFPGTSFEGNVMGVCMDSSVSYRNVAFDVRPDIVIPLRQQQPTVTGEEYPDLLKDAIQATSPTESESESDVETKDLNWKECSISIDQCLASPDTSYHYLNPSLIDLSGAFATPA